MALGELSLADLFEQLDAVQQEDEEENGVSISEQDAVAILKKLAKEEFLGEAFLHTVDGKEILTNGELCSAVTSELKGPGRSGRATVAELRDSLKVNGDHVTSALEALSSEGGARLYFVGSTQAVTEGCLESVFRGVAERLALEGNGQLTLQSIASAASLPVAFTEAALARLVAPTSGIFALGTVYDSRAKVLRSATHSARRRARILGCCIALTRPTRVVDIVSALESSPSPSSSSSSSSVSVSSSAAFSSLVLSDSGCADEIEALAKAGLIPTDSKSNMGERRVITGGFFTPAVFRPLRARAASTRFVCNGFVKRSTLPQHMRKMADDGDVAALYAALAVAGIDQPRPSPPSAPSVSQARTAKVTKADIEIETEAETEAAVILPTLVVQSSVLRRLTNEVEQSVLDPAAVGWVDVAELLEDRCGIPANVVSQVDMCAILATLAPRDQTQTGAPAAKSKEPFLVVSSDGQISVGDLSSEALFARGEGFEPDVVVGANATFTWPWNDGESATMAEEAVARAESEEDRRAKKEEEAAKRRMKAKERKKRRTGGAAPGSDNAASAGRTCAAHKRSQSIASGRSPSPGGGGDWSAASATFALGKCMSNERMRRRAVERRRKKRRRVVIAGHQAPPLSRSTSGRKKGGRSRLAYAAQTRRRLLRMEYRYVVPYALLNLVAAAMCTAAVAKARDLVRNREVREFYKSQFLVEDLCCEAAALLGDESGGGTLVGATINSNLSGVARASTDDRSQVLAGENIFTEADARNVVRRLRGRPVKAKQGKGRRSQTEKEKEREKENDDGEEEEEGGGGDEERRARDGRDNNECDKGAVTEELCWYDILFPRGNDTLANAGNVLASAPLTGCSEMPPALVESILWGCDGFRGAVEAGLGTHGSVFEYGGSGRGMGGNGVCGSKDKDNVKDMTFDDDEDDDDDDDESDSDGKEGEEEEEEVEGGTSFRCQNVCSADFCFRFQGRARTGYAVSRGVVEIAQEVAEAAFVIYHRRALQKARKEALEEAKELMRERA